MNIEYVERQQREKGLKISRGVATALQVFEWLSIVLIAWTFLFQKIDNFVSLAPELSYIIKAVGYILIAVIVVAGSLIADLLKWTQLSAMLNIFHIKNVKTGVFLTLIYAFLAYVFVEIEREMIRSIGTTHFSVPKDDKDYTDDPNYSLRLIEKEKADKDYEKEKASIEKSSCANCLSISASYEKEMSTWKRKKVKTEADRKWIANAIDALKEKRDSEVETAMAEHTAKNSEALEGLLQEYRLQTKEVKSSVQKITSRIDSAKIENELAVLARKKKINSIAMGTSLVTILLQLICRLSAFFDLKKLERLNELFDENNPLLDFLQTLPIIGKYFEDNFWVVMFNNRKAQKEADKIKYDIFNTHNSNMKIRRQSKYVAWLKAKNYSDNMLSNIAFSIFVWNANMDDETLQIMTRAYEGKKSNPHGIFASQPYFSRIEISGGLESDLGEEKSIEKNAEKFEIDEETGIILQEDIDDSDEIEDIENIIASHQAMMFRCDDSEREDILNIIASHQSILTRLKNI